MHNKFGEGFKLSRTRTPSSSRLGKNTWMPGKHLLIFSDDYTSRFKSMDSLRNIFRELGQLGLGHNLLNSDGRHHSWLRHPGG